MLSIFMLHPFILKELQKIQILLPQFSSWENSSTKYLNNLTKIMKENSLISKLKAEFDLASWWKLLAILWWKKSYLIWAYKTQQVRWL